MNAQDWKLSVTGENCPEWCAGEHADQDPEHDSIMHESPTITVELPPQVSGERLRLAFATTAGEDYNEPGRVRGPVQIELGTVNEQGLPLFDYTPVPSAEDLDQLLHNLRQATVAVEQWRGRLPSAAA